MSNETPRKFLEYPAVIDWLQWSDEFREELGKPDMPQITLTLISEMRAEIKWRQEAYDKLDDVNIKLNETIKSLESIISEMKPLLAEACGEYGCLCQVTRDNLLNELNELNK